jgi:polyhydroxyalkanoate synthesis regulator phasin
MALTSQNPETTALIEQTIAAFDSGIQPTTATSGLEIIDKWIDLLDENGDDETDEIADVLEDLKAELDQSQKDGSSPEPSVIQAYLEDLIDITQSVMESSEASAQQTELQRLVSTLENINQQVSK